MDWSLFFRLLAHNYHRSNISPWLLLLFGAIFVLTLCGYCYFCHQFVRERRRLRSGNRQQRPQPLSRLSVSPGCPHIVNTKLAHTNNLAEVY
ncbi:hemotin [Drosophila madeirensis]|uniref:Hemotin n=1 Tax=Drosophila madeirensis TaxID=30013 RepID=A0AAU9EY40_DROMD